MACQSVYACGIILQKKQRDSTWGKLNQIDKAADSKGKGIVTLAVCQLIVVVSVLLFDGASPLLSMSDELSIRSMSSFVFASAGRGQRPGFFYRLHCQQHNRSDRLSFINRDKTFQLRRKCGDHSSHLHSFHRRFLSAFPAWLAPHFQGWPVAKNVAESLATFISNAFCGAIQFFLYFPVDKLLFHKKEDKIIFRIIGAVFLWLFFCKNYGLLLTSTICCVIIITEPAYLWLLLLKE